MKTSSSLIFVLFALSVGSCKMDTFYANKRINHEYTEKVTASVNTPTVEQKNNDSFEVDPINPLPDEVESFEPDKIQEEIAINGAGKTREIQTQAATANIKKSVAKTGKVLKKQLTAVKKIKLPKLDCSSMALQQSEITDMQMYILGCAGLLILVGIASAIAGSLGGGILLLVYFIGLLFSIAGVIFCLYLLYLFFDFLTFGWMF